MRAVTVLNRVAVLFYGAMMLVAVAWGIVCGRPNVFWTTAPSFELSATNAFLGAAFGLLIVAVTRLLRHQRWVRDLSRRFRELLGPLTWRQSALLSVFSAFGEEMLFRGAIQPSVGLWGATALFAAAHFPAERQLVPWTASAGVIGLVLGYNVYRTENIIGAVVGHFVINLFNLRFVTSSDDDVTSC